MSEENNYFNENPIQNNPSSEPATPEQQPVYEAPQQPVYEAPQQPVYEAPQQPVYEAQQQYSSAPNPTQQIQYMPPVPPKPPVEKKKSNPWIAISIVCMALVLILIGVSIFNGVKTALDELSNENPPINSQNGENDNNGTGETPDIDKQDTPIQTPSSETDADGRTKYDTVGIVEKLLPSVVYIEVTGDEGSGSGSGVIMSNDGYILTNAHVIEGASSVSVKTNDEKVYTAKIVGYDSSTDVGVLKIEGTFVAAEFGDSDKIVAGETVVAIGTPFDEALFQTVTSGIASGLRDNFTFTSLNLTVDIIQHSAAINNGNSGGPLVNVYGQVIGLNSYKLSGSYENMCFALQINKVLKIATELIEHGVVVKPVLGITVQSDVSIGGAIIVEISNGSAAEEAGLKVNDLITKIDDVRVTSSSELAAHIGSCKIGQTVTITFIRDGEQQTATAVLKSSAQ